MATNPRGYAGILYLVAQRILRGVYPEGQRIPSVREMAVEMEVNPLTILRAYDKLQQINAIYAEPSMGYYVCTGAVVRLKEEYIRRFREQTIPELRQTLDLLGISKEELLTMLEQN